MGRMLNPKKKKLTSQPKRLSEVDLDGIYKLMIDSVRSTAEENPCKEVEFPKPSFNTEASFSKAAMDYHELAFGTGKDISDIISKAMDALSIAKDESSPGKCSDIWRDEDW